MSSHEIFSLYLFLVTLHCLTLYSTTTMSDSQAEVFCCDKTALTSCLSRSLFASINFANKYSPEMGPLLQSSSSDVTLLISEAADDSAVRYRCPFKEVKQ